MMTPSAEDLARWEQHLKQAANELARKERRLKQWDEDLKAFERRLNERDRNRYEQKRSSGNYDRERNVRRGQDRFTPYTSQSQQSFQAPFGFHFQEWMQRQGFRLLPVLPAIVANSISFHG